MKILSKYVLKEHAGPFLFALTALTSLLLLNYIAKQFGNLVGKGLPWTVIGEFFVLSIPFTVAMTLPMAVLVATLYAWSRLAAENEIMALKASGVGMMRVMSPVLLGAGAIAAGMLFFNDQILPRANHRLRVLQTDILQKKPTFALREQVINEVSPGRLFLRAGHVVGASGELREVTIYDLSDPTRRRTIYADSGEMAFTADRRDLLLTLYDGSMQEIPRAEPERLQRLFFRTNVVKVRGVGNDLQRSGDEDTYKSDREMSVCEMQREVEQAAGDVALAQHELADLLGGAARSLATGSPVPPPAQAHAPPRQRGIGALYCRALAFIGRWRGRDSTGRPVARGSLVGEAWAAAPLPGAKNSLQDMARRAGRDSAQAVSALDRIRAARERSAEAKRARLGAEPPPPSGTQPLPLSVPTTGTIGFDAAQRATASSTSAAMLAGAIDAARARFTDAQRTRNLYDVEIQKKFALAVACVIFVLLGAPIALRFPRGGVGLVISVSLGVFGLYYICLIGGETLADRGILTPFVSMWAANFIFTAIGLVFLARMGREASTSRGGDLGELLQTLRLWFARQARRVGIPLERRRRVA